MNILANLKSKKGFTLIELLIVIAVLGVLAVVVLVAINPAQQLARTRDAGRASTVAQLGHAIEAFAAARNGVYPTDNNGVFTCLPAAYNTGPAWITNCLLASGELQIVPAAPANSTTCDLTGAGTSIESNWCLDADGNSAVVFASAEALVNRQQCGTGVNDHAYFAYATGAGRGGLWCCNGVNCEPDANTTAGFAL